MAVHQSYRDIVVVVSSPDISDLDVVSVAVPAVDNRYEPQILQLPFSLDYYGLPDSALLGDLLGCLPYLAHFPGHPLEVPVDVQGAGFEAQLEERMGQHGEEINGTFFRGSE